MSNKISIVQQYNHKESGDEISLVTEVTPGNEQIILHQLEVLLWQAKATLNQLVRKQKTWEVKEANQEVQLEHEHSIPNNDQKLQEKEQLLKTTKRNKQYIISYPEGETKCLVTGKVASNCDIAEQLLNSLRNGDDITMPNTWKIQVVMSTSHVNTVLTNEHTQLVKDLKKPALAIYDTITPHSLDLIHMIMGICGEAGELLDAVKKAAIYNKPIDITNIKEELGDLEFYMEGLRQILGISRQEVLEANITKLRIRYGQKYSDKAAQERVDKADEGMLMTGDNMLTTPELQPRKFG